MREQNKIIFRGLIFVRELKLYFEKNKLKIVFETWIVVGIKTLIYVMFRIELNIRRWLIFCMCDL